MLDAMRIAALTGDPFLSSNELAALVRRSPDTLRKWRSDGTGPRWCWIGGRIGYRQSDVEYWLEMCTKSRAPSECDQA